MFFFPIHIDSGNRGCEAIARGSIEILKLSKQDYVGLVRDLEEDKKTKLDTCTNLIKSNRYEELNKLQKLLYKVERKCITQDKLKKKIEYSFQYKLFLKKVNGIALLTGGDMLCYGNNEVIYINDYLNKKGIKTVLWGCSIGEENLTPEKIATLNKFSAITTRESLTQELLTSLGLKNVSCYPDPAFVLKPEKTEMPECFFNKGQVVGINLSNFVGKDVGFESIIGRNILNLIETIIKNTKMDVLLIPHVFWKGQDDRIICSQVFDRYKDSGRVHLLDSEKLNYCQIRYVISKCTYFVGARTHAMISAYSMQVPAVALGYSVKSVGIAKDIGIPSQYVVDCNKLKTEDEYKNAFLDMISNTQVFLDAYKSMPSYIQKAYKAKQVVEKLL